MELKRGKTFIKSSLQTDHEKPPDPAATALTTEDAISLGGQQLPHSERGPQVSPSTQGYNRCSDREAQPDTNGGPAALCGTTFKLVRKSKNHDSVPRADRAATATGQLVGSASFPGTPSSQRMIDYRHFVPQMPFVPAVAKSIPRKRISLKRPKKCFRNLFHIRRNKTENLPSTKGEGLSSPEGPSETGGQRGIAFLPLGEELGLDGQCQVPCLVPLQYVGLRTTPGKDVLEGSGEAPVRATCILSSAELRQDDQRQARKQGKQGLWGQE